MKVLAVTSRSLFDTKWIDLSIRVSSPREFLCGIFGIVSILAVLAGKAHPITTFFGIIVLVFGFMPFGFLAPEKQLYSFLSFHMKKDNSVKRSKKVESDLIGTGSTVSEGIDAKHTIPDEIKSVETVLIEDLDIPYTLKLKTSAKKQFIPVSVLFSEPNSDEIPVATTVTGRNGKVSCTVLLENYGQRRVRVLGDDAVYYDRTVAFQRK